MPYRAVRLIGLRARGLHQRGYHSFPMARLNQHRRIPVVVNVLNRPGAIESHRSSTSTA